PVSDRFMFEAADARVEIVVRLRETHVVDPPEIIVHIVEIIFAKMAVGTNADVSVESEAKLSGIKLRRGVEQKIGLAIDDRRSGAQGETLIGLRRRLRQMHPVGKRL